MSDDDAIDVILENATITFLFIGLSESERGTAEQLPSIVRSTIFQWRMKMVTTCRYPLGLKPHGTQVRSP